MRTNYINTTEKLSEFKLGDTRKYKVYGINIFRLRKATKEQVAKYGPALKDITKYELITKKDYRSDKWCPCVVVSKHKAKCEGDHDTITVMFRTELGYKTAKCEVGVMGIWYWHPSYVDKLEEPKKDLLKTLDRLNHKQLMEYFKLVYKPMSEGGGFMSDSMYNNMKCEIRELIRIDPDTDPYIVREIGPLYFFNYMNCPLLARILCKHIDAQTETAIRIAKELLKNGVESARGVPTYAPLFTF